MHTQARIPAYLMGTCRLSSWRIGFATSPRNGPQASRKTQNRPGLRPLNHSAEILFGSLRDWETMKFALSHHDICYRPDEKKKQNFK